MHVKLISIYSNVDVKFDTLFKSNIAVSEDDADRIGILKSIYWTLTKRDELFTQNELCTNSIQVFIDKLLQITKRYEEICRKSNALYDTEFRNKIALFEHSVTGTKYCSNQVALTTY